MSRGPCRNIKSDGSNKGQPVGCPTRIRVQRHNADPGLVFFASNPKRVAMTNTYSGNDSILSTEWFGAENLKKPDILGSDVALTNADGMQEQVWGDPICNAAAACLHSNIVRQCIFHSIVHAAALYADPHNPLQVRGRTSRSHWKSISIHPG
jgi:hypothetical protein